jgi:hypothetical protein
MEHPYKKSSIAKVSGAAAILIGMFTYHFVSDIFKIGIKDGKATKEILAKQHPVKK